MGHFQLSKLTVLKLVCSCAGLRGSCQPQIVALPPCTCFPPLWCSSSSSPWLCYLVSASPYVNTSVLSFRPRQEDSLSFVCLCCVCLLPPELCKPCLVLPVSLCDGNCKSSSPCDCWVPWHCYSHRSMLEPKDCALMRIGKQRLPHNGTVAG